ncbi:MAG: hypothetical protein KIT83_05455 [Bryobacterales bacterium]|nr:hypothetical protein [Bryobacterales bacterium]
MMKLAWHSPETPDGVLYASETEMASKTYPGVRFVLRRCSVARRIALIERLAGHASRFEALKASERIDDRAQAEALLLRMDFEYLDWGLLRVSGLMVDGELPDARALFDRGPERLVHEVISRIREECELSEAERKN